jgi:hypothetical protein
MIEGELATQLPFYNKIIVPIVPIKSEEQFFSAYNFTIDQLLQLKKMEKIEFLSLYQFTRFYNCDYLDPILELSPLCISRDFLYEMKVGSLDRLYKHTDLIKKELKWALPMYHSLSPSIRMKIPIWDLSLYLEEFYKYGYEEIIDFARYFYLKTHDADRTFKLLRICDKILIGIPRRALGGPVSLSRYYTEFISKLPISNVNPQNFPIDVGKILIKDLNLISLRNCIIDEVIDICKDTEKARMALVGLNEAIKRKEIQLVVERKKVLEDTWKEVNDIINSMERTSKITKPWIGIELGIVGGLAGSIGGLPGILFGSLIGVISSVEIAEPTADVIAKIGVPSYIATIYDLKKGKK